MSETGKISETEMIMISAQKTGSILFYTVILKLPCFCQTSEHCLCKGIFAQPHPLVAWNGDAPLMKSSEKTLIQVIDQWCPPKIV